MEVVDLAFYYGHRCKNRSQEKSDLVRAPASAVMFAGHGTAGTRMVNLIWLAIVFLSGWCSVQ